MHRFMWTTFLLLFLCTTGGNRNASARSIGPDIDRSISMTDETYAYRRWIAIFNRTDVSLNNYPLEVTSPSGSGFDHAALVAVGKAQADGDDLRVEMDGSQVDRWLVDANTNSTKVWVNLSLQPRLVAFLAEGFGIGEPLSSLAVADTGGFPADGLLFDTISGEAFTYTSLDATHFLGVTRAVRDTFQGTGSIGDEIVWIEHDVYLTYGNDGIGTPLVNDDFEPAFEIASSGNIIWDYDYFGEDDGLRTAAWSNQVIQSEPVFYTGYQGGYSDPWSRVGVLVNASDTGVWQIYNPCGITHAVVSGSYRRDGSAWTTTGMKSSVDGTTWTTFYSIGTPSDTNWHDWSADRNTVAGALYLRLNFVGPPVYVNNRLDLDIALLSLDSNGTPGVQLTAEHNQVFLPLIIGH
jgi:hypothetical protein